MADKYNSHVLDIGALQPKLGPNFSYQIYVTVITRGDTGTACLTRFLYRP